jgi:hypothetical protein
MPGSRNALVEKIGMDAGLIIGVREDDKGKHHELVAEIGRSSRAR